MRRGHATINGHHATEVFDAQIVRVQRLLTLRSQHERCFVADSMVDLSISNLEKEVQSLPDTRDRVVVA